MAYWEKDQIIKVNNWLGDECYCKFSGFSLYKAMIPIKETPNERFDLILGFDKRSELFAAWNPYLYYPKKKYSVSIPYKEKDEIDNYYSFYTPLHKGNSVYGKKVLIHPDFLETFCKNWRAYLKPNEIETGYKKNRVLWADKYNPESVLWEDYCESNLELLTRDKEIVSRSHRDYSFRKRVFSKYDPPCCCICRCSIEQLLEAAHIQAVSDEGDDSAENGILLCRNHHKMFDTGMIKINGDLLEICDERVTKMAWYKEFVEKYQNKVIA